MKPSLMQLRTLIGNPRAYAVQMPDGAYLPKRDPLTNAVLVAHLRGETTIGTYVLDGDQARTLVFDLDSGDEARDEADAVAAALADLGIPAVNVGIEFSGKKGYHVWLPLAEYRPAEELRRVGRAVLALTGITCELFPKQDEARDLGNLVKMPGGVHRVSLRHNDFLARVPLPLPTTTWEGVLNGVPAAATSVSSVGADEEPFRCITKICEGISEGGRNNALYHLAAMARIRLGLPAAPREVLLREVNAGFEPPLTDLEVEKINEQPSHPLCSQLPPELHCGDACKFVNAPTGPRPGRLAKAEPGQSVLVEVESREGDIVELTHPDMTTAKGRIRGGS